MIASLASVFWIDGPEQTSPNQRTRVVLLAEALVNELSGYIFSSLREGDIALYPGLRQRLGADPACCRGRNVTGCVEQLKHEFALKAELDADWAARPVALTHYTRLHDAGA